MALKHNLDILLLNHYILVLLCRYLLWRHLKLNHNLHWLSKLHMVGLVLLFKVNFWVDFFHAVRITVDFKCPIFKISCRVRSFIGPVWAWIARNVLVNFLSFFFREIVIYTTYVKNCFTFNLVIFYFVWTPHRLASLLCSRSLIIASRLERLVTIFHKTLVAALAVLWLRIVANFFHLVVRFRLLQLDYLFSKFNARPLNLILLLFSCISLTQLLWILLLIFSPFALLIFVVTTKITCLMAFGLVCVHLYWARTTFAFSVLANTVLSWCLETWFHF